MHAIHLWLTQNAVGEFCYTALTAMVPVVELRGAIPFGVLKLGLSFWPAFFAAVLGNLIPVPFIIIYIRRVFSFLRRRFPRFNSLVDKLERKAHLKGNFVTKYRFIGLAVLVAIPLPGTGAWTGALAAAFLDMRLRKALPAIAVGVIVAGLLISVLTLGVNALI